MMSNEPYTRLSSGALRALVDQARRRPDGMTQLEQWLSTVLMVRGSGAGDLLVPRGAIQGMLQAAKGRPYTRAESYMEAACG